MLLSGVGMHLSPSFSELESIRCARQTIDKLTSSSEMQLFLLGFIVIQICEIFTVGGIPLHDSVRKVSIETLFFSLSTVLR
jgi:hypothetical protein